MISLADYLTEFPEAGDEHFQSLTPAKPKPQKKPSFEHLTLVSDALPAQKRRSKPVPEHLEAIPEMGEAEKALDDVSFDGADFGFDAEQAAAPQEIAFALPQLTEEDVEAARAEGREAGRAEAFEEAEARIEAAVEAALQAERARAAAHEAEAVEAARLEALGEEGGRLAELLTDKLERIETALSTSLAGVLKPIALDVRTRQTIGDLATAVATMSLDGRSLSLEAVGPAALLDAFAEALGPRRGFVAFEADENLSDIRISCDQTTLETRLADWKRALEEALT
ncbi:hypothetical protein [Jiella sonneratiae]|uniref:Flagellar assembly protein FliH/Type III secretion system HrpE domain-containing protein n=1 Tax=Jiella sonneratiae TaxID=2816856 RepID=A0ABS3J1P6_9HYPH|nr:hypothetical protein [Jiella sonneratiae]MBO0903579.1 hypothetical protein [Jiella sonneratiae]